MKGRCDQLLCLLVPALAVWMTSATDAEIIDRVLARVGTRLILLSDVRAFRSLGLLEGFEPLTPIVIPAQAGIQPSEAMIVTKLIDRDLMLAEVDRYALPEPEVAAVEVVIEDLQERLGASALQQVLRLVGWSENGLRAVVRENLRIERYLEERFTAAAAPTDQEVLRHYRDHAAEFSRGGVAQPLEAVRDRIRAVLAAERREALIADWIAGLRRRADVVRLDTHE